MIPPSPALSINIFFYNEERNVVDLREPIDTKSLIRKLSNVRLVSFQKGTRPKCHPQSEPEVKFRLR